MHLILNAAKAFSKRANKVNSYRFIKEICSLMIRFSFCFVTLQRASKVLLIICLFCSQNLRAEEGKQLVTLNEKNAPLEKIFQQIKSQTGYMFWFSSGNIKNAKPVSINVKNEFLPKVLDVIFQDQPYTYIIVDKVIVIRTRDKLYLSGNTEFILERANINIKGRVINETGEPIPGVTVTVKGTSISTSTDGNGEFVMMNSQKYVTLVFTGANIETFLYDVRDQADIIVKLTTKINKLDEVQVIAYGTSSRRNGIGDVGTVKSEDIARQPVSNPLQALQGRVAGLLITQKSGLYGGGFTVQIRGRNSIAKGNDPLYIIDGVPYLSQLPGNLNPAGGSPLSFINPSDIESIDVLKDADATAIYGSRGANGVILITTKKAISGKTRLDIHFNAGVEQVTTDFEMMNTTQYLQMRKEAFRNENVLPTPSNAPDLVLWDTTRNTNWKKALLGGNASYINSSASVSGGNNNLQYTFGVNFLKEGTVFPSSTDDRKTSAHLNLKNISNDLKLRVILNANYTFDNSTLPTSDLTTFVGQLPPNAPDLYNKDGSLVWTWSSALTSPYPSLRRKYNAKTTNLVGNLTISYNLIKGLDLKSSFGYVNLQSNELSTTPIVSLQPSSSATGTAFFANNNTRNWIVEPQLTYRLLGPIGKIDFLLGSTFQQSSQNGQIFRGTGYTTDVLIEDIKSAPTLVTQSVNNVQYKYNAFFGRLSYSLMDKYLLNLTGRRDGSSRFGPENRFHNFYSVGLGWIFSKEKQFSAIENILSYGKLRGSYGTTGNDQVPDYSFYDLYNTTTYPYQGYISITPLSLYNPNLQWEETKKVEGAIDLGFIQDRILTSFAYFQNRSNNQIVLSPLPSITGFSGINTNLPALVQNYGFEFSLNAMIIKSKQFSWTTNFNISVQRNKLIEFVNLPLTSYASVFVIGQPLNIIKAYHFLNVDAATGRYQFLNSSGGAVFSPNFSTDQVDIIKLDPQYYGGFQSDFRFRSFSLNCSFQFVKQIGRNAIFIQGSAPGLFIANTSSLVSNNEWRIPEDNEVIQRFSQTSGTISTGYSLAKQSSAVYADASFIRCKNISLSYKIPFSWLAKHRLLDCNIYIQGQNLFTLTPLKGIDPENQSLSALPPLRVITGGISISL